MQTHIAQDGEGKKYRVEVPDGTSISHAIKQASKELGFPVTLYEEAKEQPIDQHAVDNERRLRVKAEDDLKRADAARERADTACDKARDELRAAVKRAEEAEKKESSANMLRSEAVRKAANESATAESLRDELATERAKIQTLEARVTAFLAEQKKPQTVEHKERKPWAGTVTVESRFPEGGFKELRFEPSK